MLNAKAAELRHLTEVLHWVLTQLMDHESELQKKMVLDMELACILEALLESNMDSLVCLRPIILHSAPLVSGLHWW